jgi:aldehyde:ferredoxin oxidoreductase
MPYGWMGTNLEIDLNVGNIEKSQGDPELTRAYLGGKGINAKIFWERVSPEVAPFSPDNLLILSTGILTGTMVPSASKAVITFKSPQTGLHYHSAMGGFWPAAMKHAGYDTIIIRGKSPNPVYLWINNDKVELRDASHLWGKGTYETKRIIREELGNNQVEIASIGPAGENKCYAASIESSFGASASRGGPGAVMGDKNLKAIAVYGTRDVNIARPQQLFELCEQILDRSGPYKEHRAQDGMETGLLDSPRSVPFGNLDEMYEELSPDSQLRQDVDGLHAELTNFVNKADSTASCFSCGIRCRRGYAVPGGGHYYLKCTSWSQFMVSFKIIDFDFNIECGRLCQQYGLDVISVSRSGAFAIDLYEKGILTKQDTDGMHLEWGNKEVAYSLIEKICRREGIGDILANGVYQAARQIGRGAEERTYHSKKLEYIGDLTPYIFMPYAALAQAVSDKSDFTRNVSSAIYSAFFKSREQRQEMLNSPYWIYPKGYEKYYLPDFSYDGSDYESICRFVAYDDETYSIIDTAGICSFWTIFLIHSPINSRALMADLISNTTGMDISEDELTAIAGRTLNLVRASNVRSGVRRKDDRLSKLFFRKAAPKPYQTLDPDMFKKWINRYYELKGWNSEGVPTRQTLQELGLDSVRQDFERRGILTD